MPSNTTNLNLYKKDPIADKDQTFNITTMMNENWDKIDQSAGLTAAQLAQLTNPNLLINGDFQIWQRGTSFTNITTDFYSADRWIVRGLAGSSHSITRESSAIIPEFSLIRVTRNNNVLGILTQNIENLRQFSNKTVTLSFWARAIGNKFRTGMAVAGNYGLGTEEIYHCSEMDLTENFKKYIVTILIPNLQNKTFGSGHYLSLYLFRDDVAGRTIDISNVKLELGSIATPFHSKNYAEELASCQRYYLDKAVGRVGQVETNLLRFIVPAPATMRNLPTISSFTLNNMSGLAQTGFVASSFGIDGSTIIITANKTSHGLIDGNIVVNGLDAEIY